MPSRENLETKLSDNNWEIILKTYSSYLNYLEKYEIDNSYRYYGAAIDNPNLEYPPFTNYTHNFKDVLDHILFSKKGYPFICD